MIAERPSCDVTLNDFAVIACEDAVVSDADCAPLPLTLMAAPTFTFIAPPLDTVWAMTRSDPAPVVVTSSVPVLLVRPLTVTAPALVRDALPAADMPVTLREPVLLSTRSPPNSAVPL